MTFISKRNLHVALALGVGLALGACSSGSNNHTLYSVKQPVVERTNYTFDMQASNGQLSIPEQQRLADWFETMDLRYGDRISIEDPMMSGATRDAVARLAARSGIMVSEGAPVTSGQIQPGNVRVVLTRSVATVDGCPDWSRSSDMNYSNSTSPNFGCAVHGNLASMVANPEDLLTGQKGSGTSVVTTSSKAIDSYREQEPTGTGGLKQSATSGGGN